jgi:hypothetical protein
MLFTVHFLCNTLSMEQNLVIYIDKIMHFDVLLQPQKFCTLPFLSLLKIILYLVFGIFQNSYMMQKKTLFST